MRLIGIMPCRNEAWVLGLSARVALNWCDELVILDHASTDRSTEIMMQLQNEYTVDRVRLLFEDDGQWDEMRHRQRLLEAARKLGATHIAIIDADEILTGNLSLFGPSMKSLLSAPAIRPESIVQLPGYNLRGGIDRYHSSGIWGNRWFSLAFADDPRLSWSGDKFHAREPAGMTLRNARPIEQGNGGILHLWGASERRLKAKHAMYKVTERIRWPDTPIQEIETMYNWAIYGRLPDPHDSPSHWKFSSVPSEWWEPYANWMQYLDIDAEPWQESQVRQEVAHHGSAMFQGLDLFGIV